MRISISMCLRQHLLHIQSSSLKLRHIFKFNTQRSTITGSECETFEGTEMSITVRMANHSPYVKSLCNRHIKQHSHMDTSIFTHAHITTTGTVQITHFISNFHSNPLISMNRRDEPYLHTSLCFTFKNKAWRRNSRIHEVHWRWSRRDRQSYVTTILHNFRFPHSAFVIFGEEHTKRVVSQIPFNVPIVFNVTA